MRREARCRIVVTGVGSVSALGVGGGSFLAGALLSGVSGIAPINAFSTTGCSSHLGGEVGDLSRHLSAEESRRLARVSQLTVVACRLAAADAGFAPGALSTLGLVLGSEYGDFRSSEEFAGGFLSRGPLGLSPVVFPNTVMNAMAAQAAIALGVQGPMLTVNQAGVAGELAVARAATLITTGRASTMLAGGVDELCPILYHGLAELGSISPQKRRAEGCWPFDRRASGTVVGEGATVVFLETAEAAQARGARVYAELAGVAWGNLMSPAHGFPRRHRCCPAVIGRVLAVAGIEHAELDAVYLTGTGNPSQDACELELVSAAFGEGVGPVLTAVTPLVGEHAGAGVLRVASAAVATVAGGRVPGLPDLRESIRPELHFATGPAAPTPGPRAVLVHGLGRGGGHAALLLRPAQREAGARSAA